MFGINPIFLLLIVVAVSAVFCVVHVSATAIRRPADATSGYAWVVAPLFVGLLIPSAVIFCVDIFVGHISIVSSLANILRRPLLLVLWGLIPFIALSYVCQIAARRFLPDRVACLAIGGVAGIAWYMIPQHVAVYYPTYGPSGVSSTSAIAFVLIPLFCFGPLAIGLLVGWAVSLHPRFSIVKESAPWTFSLRTVSAVLMVIAAVCGLLGLLTRSLAAILYK